MSESAVDETVKESQLDGKSVEDAKRKKKKTKTSDIILRELPSNASDEEKIQLLCQKYHTVLQEQKDATNKIKQYEHAVQTIRNERDQLQGERNRLLLQKDKLETLCRELQKQNKLVQEESLARCRSEDEKRRTISDHFQTSITSIQVQLNEYQTRNTELRKENQELADKLEQFIKQHKLREEHVEQILRTRELEAKMAEAKLQKTQCLLDQERIKAQQVAIQMKEEAKLMQERVDAHIAVENKLKEQIEFYKTKYQNFNKTIAQSNKLFDNAKSEMEKLVKRIKQSDHEIVEWRGKWELSQRSMLELVNEHKDKCDELIAAQKKVERLGNLCRALRAQLMELRQTGFSNTTEDPTAPDARGDHPVADAHASPAPSPEPTPDVTSEQPLTEGSLTTTDADHCDKDKPVNDEPQSSATNELD